MSFYCFFTGVLLDLSLFWCLLASFLVFFWPVFQLETPSFQLEDLHFRRARLVELTPVV